MLLKNTKTSKLRAPKWIYGVKEWAGWKLLVNSISIKRGLRMLHEHRLGSTFWFSCALCPFCAVNWPLMSEVSLMKEGE